MNGEIFFLVLAFAVASSDEVQSLGFYIGSNFTAFLTGHPHTVVLFSDVNSSDYAFTAPAISAFSDNV